MRLLEGKTIIVTGAGSNVGRAAEKLFGAHGARLVAVDRDAGRIAPAPHDHDGERLAIEADLTSADACRHMVERAVERFGAVHGLCNTFGIDPPSARGTLETSEEDWDRIMLVNLKAVFLCCRAVLPAMRANGGGSIVNIASQGSLLTLPGMTAYGVSKAGVLQLTRQIASDHGADGIRANCVCPSGLEQPSLDRLSVLSEEQLSRRADAMKRMSPLGRVCTPQDVANAMLYLVSDLSAFVTAAALPVEGGGTAVLRF
ncbi:MAG: SDR family NAD(P)-dependent oxidoreductase [Hyphomicrobiales bacterium]